MTLAGLSAVLASGESADREESATTADPGCRASFAATASLPGGRAADILATRSLTRALDLHRNDAHNLELALTAYTLTPDRGRIRAFIHGLAGQLARDLARDLARNLDRVLAIAHDLDLGRDLGRHLDIARTVARELEGKLESTLTHKLQNALSQAASLVRWADAVEVDASGNDISALELKEM